MKKLLSVVSLLPVFLSACDPAPLPENAAVAAEKLTKQSTQQTELSTEIVVTNVVRVFLHEPPNHYSVMSLGKQNKLILHDLNNMSQGVTVYADVPPSQSMWFLYYQGYPLSAEIHVHGPEDVNGAGWSQTRGKTRVTGTTTVVK